MKIYLSLMTEYLNIERELQKQLIRKLKNNCVLSWTNLAKEIHVTRSMALFYQSGRCRIPKDKLQKLVQLSKTNFDVETLSFLKGNYSLQTVVVPQMSEKLAEFLGLLYGDGCLGNYNYLIDISGDSKADFLYHHYHVKPLICELFDLIPRFKYEKHAQEIHTQLTTKMLHDGISKVFSFPIGHKKGRMHIPKEIYQNDCYKRAFLRGLFDTDGGVHRHHKTSIQVQFTSYDPVFMNQVRDLFREFGFNARINKTDLQLRGKTEIDRFFSEIKPANPKHLYKYKKFKETGVVPLHREIDYSSLNNGLISYS